MENKCEDELLQNSYLSPLFYRQIRILKNSAANTLSVVNTEQRKQKINRHKTQLYIINDLNQDCVQNLKRKNSFIGCKKYRKLELQCKESKFTPYQSRKRHEKMNFKLKKEKVSAQIEHLSIALQQSKADWLVVKQAGQNSSPHFKTEQSAQRVKVYCDTSYQQNIKSYNQEMTQKDVSESKHENERQKSIKIMLSYYKNKNVIKKSLKSNKIHNIPNSELRQSINLKLSTLSQSKNQTKMVNLKQKIKSIYVSKRQLTLKNKKVFDEGAAVTENLRNNLLTSTHSDLTDKTTKNKLEGVLNSFKVDMKCKQKSRPRTASRSYKLSLPSNNKNAQKNASTKAIQMTGWEEEPDRFERDIFFS